MGMTLSLWRVSLEQLKTMLGSTEAAKAYFGDDLVEDYDAWQAFRDAMESDPTYLDLGKLYPGVEYLLAGRNLGDGEINGAEIDFSRTEVLDDGPFHAAFQGSSYTEWESSYGCKFYNTPGMVKKTSNVLNEVNDADLASRFDPDTWNENPAGPPGTWCEESLPYLMELFSKLRAFYAVAAERNEAIVTDIE